jgi:hypothetical protein
VDLVVPDRYAVRVAGVLRLRCHVAGAKQIVNVSSNILKSITEPLFGP